MHMEKPEDPSRLPDERIVITDRSDIDFWCQHFSISPFTLFHLLKTVGNDPKQIGEFLHIKEEERQDEVGERIRNVSIL
jgi:hypothetical protein